MTVNPVIVNASNADSGSSAEAGSCRVSSPVTMNTPQPGPASADNIAAVSQWNGCSVRISPSRA